MPPDPSAKSLPTSNSAVDSERQARLRHWLHAVPDPISHPPASSPSPAALRISASTPQIPPLSTRSSHSPTPPFLQEPDSVSVPSISDPNGTPLTLSPSTGNPPRRERYHRSEVDLHPDPDCDAATELSLSLRHISISKPAAKAPPSPPPLPSPPPPPPAPPLLPPARPHTRRRPPCLPQTPPAPPFPAADIDTARPRRQESPSTFPPPPNYAPPTDSHLARGSELERGASSPVREEAVGRRDEAHATRVGSERSHAERGARPFVRGLSSRKMLAVPYTRGLSDRTSDPRTPQAPASSFVVPRAAPSAYTPRLTSFDGGESHELSLALRPHAERFGRSESSAQHSSRPPSFRAAGQGSAFRRKASERRLTGVPSDLGLGFERVVSEHFGRAPSGTGIGTVVQTDSRASGAGISAGNPVAGLHVTFMSIQSYGNTDKSSGSLGEEATGLVGGAYRSQWSHSDRSLGGFGPHPQHFPNTWSSAGLGLPSKVEEAAGSLYRAGSIDNRWSIQDLLGTGAYCGVRRGEGKHGEGHVAIKIVSKRARDLFSPSGVCREVISCRLFGKHPNIAECHEVYEDDRFIYIVMELLTGGPMLPRIADSHYYPRYCENDVVTLVRCLIRALSHLHQLGVVHRDVKPENVLYASRTLDPTIKLTDFGIAYTDCDTSAASDMVGTPLYVAPEVLLKQPYGRQADMWNLGVIVHILLTGYPPFDDDDLVQLINKVKHNCVRLIGDEWGVVSEDARDFVNKLLTRDVSRRITAEQALKHAWLAKPRPPPFPAPPVPSKALNRKNRVKVPPTTQSRQDGTLPLKAAQINLQSFVRKEWKGMVKSEPSDRNLQLSMLVSLSEKNLGAVEVDEASIEGSKDEATPADEPVSKIITLDGEDVVDASQLVPFSSSATSVRLSTQRGGRKRAKTTLDGEILGLENQEEQERLRQKRLLVEATLTEKKKKEAKKSDCVGDKTMSLSNDSICTHSASIHQESQSEGTLTNSKVSEESMVLLSEAFEYRRDADAEEDVGKIQKQRAQKPRGTLIGRRTRQSNSTKKSVKSDRSKTSRTKGGRVRRKQEVSP